jgi:hypothetical protein
MRLESFYWCWWSCGRLLWYFPVIGGLYASWACGRLFIAVDCCLLPPLVEGFVAVICCGMRGFLRRSVVFRCGVPAVVGSVSLILVWCSIGLLGRGMFCSPLVDCWLCVWWLLAAVTLHYLYTLMFTTWYTQAKHPTEYSVTSHGVRSGEQGGQKRRWLSLSRTLSMLSSDTRGRPGLLPLTFWHRNLTFKF